MLSDVRSFMTMFHVTGSVSRQRICGRVLSPRLGDFANTKRANDILIQHLRVEPTTGTVLDAGIQKEWNEDGSANVLVVTSDHLEIPRTASGWSRTPIVGW